MIQDSYAKPEVVELQEIPEPVIVDPKTVDTTLAIIDPADKPELGTNESFFREAVDRHFEYLTGKKGFAKDADRIKEMVSFVQTVGRMLAWDYLEFEPSFLYFIEKLRNEPKASENGRFFRYLNGCEKTYDIGALNQYRLVATWAIGVANAWPTRAKRARQTDAQMMVKGMRKQSADNLMYFIRKMSSYAIQ